MNTETLPEGRSPLVGINDLTDSLAGKYLLHAEFTGRNCTVPFPGEGRIGYYQMVFALGTSMRRTPDNLLFYGKNTRLGIQVQKTKRWKDGELQPGFDIHLRRIIIINYPAYPPVYALAHSEIKADMTTGEMSLNTNRTHTHTTGPLLAELKSVIADLQTPTTHLVDAGFTERLNGTYHRLVPAE